jgi:hypothetical protein
VDAIEAGRAALSGRARGLAKTADGNAEAIRALLIAKRSARDTRIKCLNQIRHLGFTAPDELRERLRGVPRGSLARTAAGFRPARTPDVVTAATKLALSTLGRRVLDLEATTKCLDDRLRGAGARHRPWPVGPRRRRCRHRRHCAGHRRRQPAPVAQRSRSRTSAVSPRSKRLRARSCVAVSTAVGTVKPTMRCGASCSPAWAPTPAPALTSPGVSSKDEPNPRSEVVPVVVDFEVAVPRSMPASW